MKGDTVVGTTEVDASIGQGAEAVFTPVATGVQTVQITGQRRTIDVTRTNNGATFNARQLAALPIARNVEAIIQLAPNTTRADSRFAGGASFGGGAASGNSYYINGFPVVNPRTGQGASQLPFGAIAEAQVLTGGFGAEFGRSIGGVVNIITKSGTNN
nr:TonB-dependent receptor plug domain-containing protein [Massilia polaris]